ncbi:MAG: SAM-dependent methyltransferase [Elusimicrobia bacterium]|nr:SAM-dependent methyltransferase [Candidatus Obscuribacterium magneticum]
MTGFHGDNGLVQGKEHMNMKTKSQVQELIVQEVRRKGPMDFGRFVDLALYHPVYGYYNRSANPRGRGGDYFTAPQTSPLFAEILAEAVVAMKEAVGTEHFTFIEMGAGRGELLAALLSVLKREKKLSGVNVWAVERSRPARDHLWRALSRFPRTHVVESLDDVEYVGGLEGCLFSNEFFDALPFHRLRYTASGWKEIYVVLDGDRLAEEEGPLSESVANHAKAVIPAQAGIQSGVHGLASGLRRNDGALQRSLGAEASEQESQLDKGIFMEGQEIEVRPTALKAMEEWGRVLNRGYVLTFDYGYSREELYRPDRIAGTWLCYHKHQVNRDPFAHLGDQDITSHVDFTQLAEAGRSAGLEPSLFCSQGLFLSHVGRDRIQGFLSEKGGALHTNVISAIQQLMHPGAMGETFWTLVQTKGVSLPASWQAIPNRSRRLAPSSIIM